MEFESRAQAAIRGTRRDSRANTGLVVAYQNEQGQPQAWTGDDDAPYVKAIIQPGTTADSVLKANSGAVAVADLVVKASPGVLYQVFFLNTNGNTLYLMVLDAVSAVAAAVPTVPAFPVCGGQFAALDFGAYGIPMNVGIVLACSSTSLTYTASADGVFTGLYL